MQAAVLLVELKLKIRGNNNMTQSEFLDYDYEYEDTVPDFEFSPALFNGRKRIFIAREADSKKSYFYVWYKYVAHCIDVTSCDLFERNKWYRVSFENAPDTNEYDWCRGLDGGRVDNAQIDTRIFNGRLAMRNGVPTFIISFNKKHKEVIERTYTNGTTDIVKLA